MDYDFITTCNWTATGTYTLRAYRGSYTNVVTTHYASIFYRKKGTSTWTPLNSSGQMVVDSTGEWEVANNWNKSGNDCLTHSYYGITAIDKCTDVYFNEATLGTTIGNYFLSYCWCGCTSLSSMPSGFNLPTGITGVGYGFLYYCWYDCASLRADGYTEDIYFKYASIQTFGGTCPITPDSPSAGSSVAVNRPQPIAPTVTTQSATNIATTSCTGNGNITATGGANCTRRGFCYKVGTSGDPTTSDSVAYDDGSFGTGAFTKIISGLTPNTSYRVRAYAVNSAGTGYGTTVQVTTLKAFKPRTMWF
jgi:hypothetical protein